MERLPLFSRVALAVAAGLLCSSMVRAQVTFIVPDNDPVAGRAQVDADDNVYVFGESVTKVSPSGEMTELINSTGDGAGHECLWPVAMAIGPSGQMAVACAWSDNAFLIAPDGSITQIIDSTGDGIGATLYRPYSVAIDSSGNIFVAGDGGPDVLFRITPTGSITYVFYYAGTSVTRPFEVVTDSWGNIDVLNYRSTSVQQISPDGVVTEMISAGDPWSGNFLEGAGTIVADHSGNVYVSDPSFHRVLKSSPTGEVTTAIWYNSPHYITKPLHMAVDREDNLYISTMLPGTVWKATPDGQVSLFMGLDEGTGGPLGGQGPIAVDAAGNVFVLNAGSFYGIDGGFRSVVRKTVSGGVAEVGSAVYDEWASPDNLFAPNHPFEFLTVDSVGNVYVSNRDHVARIEASWLNDCNQNGVPDNDELTDGTSFDCNSNGWLDECEIDPAVCGTIGCKVDCDNSGTLDECQLATTPAMVDCQANGIIDACEIASGTVSDANADGVPDSCCQGGSAQVYQAAQRSSRYLRFTFDQQNANFAGIRITPVSLPGFPEYEGMPLWVGPPDLVVEDGSHYFATAPLQCEPYFDRWEYSNTAHATSTAVDLAVHGAEIIPGASYRVEFIGEACDRSNEANFIKPMDGTDLLYTGGWGDIVPPFGGQPDFNDIAGVVARFVGETGAPSMTMAQLQPNTVISQRPVDFNDISAVVSAFLGDSYVDSIGAAGPCTCPSGVTCGATACSYDSECGSGYCIDGACTDACGRCSP